MWREGGQLMPDSGDNNGVLVFIDANRKADILAFCEWDRSGLLQEPPERLAEGKFVALLSPGVHDVVTARPR
jgi:hypothetical protein